MTTERDEHGFTVIELGITMLLLGLVMAMLFQSLYSVQTAVDREVGRNTRNDRLRLAVFAIERQVRSGNVFADPASDNDPAHGIVPNMSFRVYTQADASTLGASRCVQWRIDEQRLESRDWSPDWRTNNQVTEWRILADGIQNRDASPAIPAFSLATSTAYGRRLLEVSLVAEGDTSERGLQRIDSAITGRNTGYGSIYPTNICDDIPTYP